MAKVKKARFTKQEIVKMRNAFMSDSAIGKKLNLSREAVFCYRKKYGIKSRYDDKPKRNAGIIEEYKKGTTVVAIAKKNGIAYITAFLIIKKAGVPKNQHGHKRISKKELLNLQKKLVTDVAIGKKLGISRQAVYQFRQRLGIESRREK